jgi:hypothetical protein
VLRQNGASRATEPPGAGGLRRMRIYEGSPRQDFEEVFRSIGAFLDQRGMKDVLLVEAPDGFIVQGLVITGASAGQWSDNMGVQVKETLTFLDDDIARFMEEAAARRGRQNPMPNHDAGYYETAFRVLGRYMDDQKPRDVFFFEQDGAFVVRLLMSSQAGSQHQLSEFTRDDIAQMVASGPRLRNEKTSPGANAPASA